MGANSRTLIQRVSQWLQAQGWSAGEATLRMPDGSPLWKVDATQADGQSVSVTAGTRSGAWDLACRHVGRLATDR